MLLPASDNNPVTTRSRRSLEDTEQDGEQQNPSGHLDEIFEVTLRPSVFSSEAGGKKSLRLNQSKRRAAGKEPTGG
jgi:hypothetical protein